MVYKKQLTIILAVLPLMFGGLIYICFRGDNLLLFSWLNFVNLDYSHFQKVNYNTNTISSYIIYSFPNGLWTLSGLLILKLFLGNEFRLLSVYSIIFIITSLLYEFAQFFRIIPGTFDIFDVLTIITFSAIGFFVNITGGKNEKV